jgi:hypothetical protein
MGTSRNDRSPEVPTWKPALLALGNKSVPAERQIQEVWRAALAHSQFLESELRNELFPTACQLVSAGLNKLDALEKFDQSMRERGASSFFLDLARRSLLRATAEQWDTTRFAADVMTEVAGYYISRDLPSYIGAKNRVWSPKEALVLKDSLKELTRSAAQSAGEVASDGSNWSTFVDRALERLTSAGGPRQ